MNSLEDEQSQGRKITICRDMVADTILEARLLQAVLLRASEEHVWTGHLVPISFCAHHARKLS